MKDQLQTLQRQLDGELHTDQLHRLIYATDASVYREVPLAVIVPQNKEDLLKIIRFAKVHDLSITPRTGGTSQSGQAIGKSLIVDCSKLNRILELNVEERWVRVEPGVVRDLLNRYLQPYGLFFSPITSTANRAMIGGMVGNNSCGSNSIVYGSTRDHVRSLKTILSDGSECTFEALEEDVFHQKRQADSLEGKIYQQIYTALSQPEVQQRIREEFPKEAVQRRNTGYAVDLLLKQQPFSQNGQPFNACTILCGSEGTLAFTTEITLALDPLPPSQELVVAIHCQDVIEALRCAQIAMTFQPGKCELIDKVILDCTKSNAQLTQNRFFLEGDPGAVLLVAFRADQLADAVKQARELQTHLKSAALGYAYPIVYAPQTKKVWALRKAGLGVLGNLPGDPKSVSCIEDTAVALEDLPEYIEQFAKMMDDFGQNVVYYAHAGAGELHLRPILNMKTAEGQQAFYEISRATAQLVKKFEGSLSGEHGDGRVRAEFIPLMIGEQNYELLRHIKQTWDPHQLFNPGKIVDAPPMKGDFRYEAGQSTPEYETVMNFSEVGGYMRMAEKCNGVGACRKQAASGGTMCPSYQASRQEKDTTRARANALREFLGSDRETNPFDRPDLFDVLKRCLSCKGCINECPSSVDMSALKAEFLHQYYRSHRRPFSDRIFGNIGSFGKWGVRTSWITNRLLANTSASKSIKGLLGMAPQRSLPQFSPTTLWRWYRKNYPYLRPRKPTKGAVYFFCDEFTNYQDVPLGIQAIELLARLGYEVMMLGSSDSGRAPISKGFLHRSQRLANKNVAIFSAFATPKTPLVGLEPSAMLTFRDEYPRLAKDREKANQLKSSVFLLEEFLMQEINKGNITPESFTDRPHKILLHGHCHQKAIVGAECSAFVLALPKNYDVGMIPSGCCGMAGSFGYEKDNYELSMAIGELILFPAVRASNPDAIIAAPGLSCREQILAGTGRTAFHPAMILHNALKTV